MGRYRQFRHRSIPFRYARLDYQNGLLIADSGSGQGLVTLNNEVITPLEFTWVLPRDNSRFVVHKESKWGLIDNANNIMIPIVYDHIDSRLKDHYIVRNRNGLSGIYNYNGENLIPEKFIFYTVDGNKIFCTEEGRPLILDIKDPTKTIFLENNISFKETAVHYTVNELFHQIFTVNGKEGVMNSGNEILIPPLYDDITNLFDGSIYLVKQNRRYGIINYKNNIVREIKYDGVQVRKEVIVLKQKGLKDEYYDIQSAQRN